MDYNLWSSRLQRHTRDIRLLKKDRQWDEASTQHSQYQCSTRYALYVVRMEEKVWRLGLLDGRVAHLFSCSLPKVASCHRAAINIHLFYLVITIPNLDLKCPSCLTFTIPQPSAITTASPETYCKYMLSCANVVESDNFHKHSHILAFTRIIQNWFSWLDFSLSLQLWLLGIHLKSRLEDVLVVMQ